MPRVGLPPFKTLQAGIVPGDFVFEIRGRARESAEVLRDWDCSTELRVETDLQVASHKDLFQQLDLHDSSTVGLVLTASSSTVHEDQISEPVIIDGSGSYSVSLDVVPTRTGGVLQLERQIVLLHADPASPLAPNQAGSVLWRDEERTNVVLQGESTKFPSEQVDFKHIGLDPKGLWVVRVDDTDLHRHFHGAVRLLLNKNHPKIAMMTSGEESGEVALLLEVLQLDIASTLISHSLENQEFVLDSDQYPNGSLGQNFSFLLRRVFNTEDLPQIRQQKADYPNRFVAKVQAEFGPSWSST